MELVLTYKYSPYITGGTYINMRIGESRAGIKCLNGICRQMPAFSGVEGTQVVRY